MAKYIVTGGETGDSSVEISGKTYKPGDTVELKSGNDWLVKQGYLKPLGKKGAS